MGTVEQTAVSKPRPTDFIPGYRLVQLLGRGGMGEVYEAVQLSLSRKVAVKLLNADLAKDEQFVGRFEKEGAALAALNHPNIVSIVDKGRTDTTYYLVMEYVDGRSLRERMRDPDLDDSTRLRMVAQIAKALEYAHQRGVVHRDIKPENILFAEQAGDIAKVTDFGLAGLDASMFTEHNLTATHMAMGTAHYMAPEQKVDARKADHRADLFALGVVIYELFVGDVPQGTFPPMAQKRPGVDKRLDAIVSRCLKPSPDDRYASATELLLDLEPLLPQMSIISSPRMKPLDRALLQARRVARKVALYTGLALVLWAVTIIAASFLRQRARDEKSTPGARLTTDSGARFPLTARGRLDHDLNQLSLGDGPDMLSLVALGRKVRLDGAALVFDRPEGETAGHTVLDAPLEGAGLSLSVEVVTEELPASALEPLWAVFRGPRPEPKSAVLLLGQAGRYVALVASGAGQSPVLEWSLGSGRQGSMTTQLPTAPGPQQLELRLDPDTFELVALVGKDRDRRRVAEPLQLGKAWREAFGDGPRPAVGCLDGTCAFRQLAWSALDVQPPPPPPPPPEPVVAAAPGPPPLLPPTLKPKPTVVEKKKPTGKRR